MHGGKVEGNGFPVSTLPSRWSVFSRRSCRWRRTGRYEDRLRIADSRRFELSNGRRRSRRGAARTGGGELVCWFLPGYHGQRSPWPPRLARPSPIIDFCNFPRRFALPCRRRHFASGSHDREAASHAVSAAYYALIKGDASCGGPASTRRSSGSIQDLRGRSIAYRSPFHRRRVVPALLRFSLISRDLW